MKDIFEDIRDIEELNLENEFVIRSHKIAEKLKKKGININKPIWGNLKAS